MRQTNRLPHWIRWKHPWIRSMFFSPGELEACLANEKWHNTILISAEKAQSWNKAVWSSKWIVGEILIPLKDEHNRSAPPAYKPIKWFSYLQGYKIYQCCQIPGIYIIPKSSAPTGPLMAESNPSQFNIECQNESRQPFQACSPRLRWKRKTTNNPSSFSRCKTSSLVTSSHDWNTQVFPLAVRQTALFFFTERTKRHKFWNICKEFRNLPPHTPIPRRA